MARKSKHDQRATPSGWVCDKCRNDDCNNCIDIMRVVIMGKNPMCYCKRKGHSGEAVDKQITDPEDGTVWGPELRVTKEGEVIRGGYESGGDNRG